MQVSILMVRALLGAVERAGGNQERFLREARLDPDALKQGAMWLELADYLRVLDVALEVSADPALGLHLGEHARSNMFDVVGPLAEQAGTLRESIETAIRYSRILADGHEPRIHEGTHMAAIRFPSLLGDIPAVRFTAEFVMAALLPVLQLFVGPSAQPREVRFAYSMPKHIAEYERVFRGAQRFDQKHTELVVPRAWLNRSQRYRDAELRSLLEEQAERRLERVVHGASLATRIERVLASRAGHALTMQEVARALEISERSLRRRMLEDGLSFPELASRSRMNEAKRLLRRPGTSIQETAYELGFASAAGFHRAFKRWTGMTPGEFRRAQRSVPHADAA